MKAFCPGQAKSGTASLAGLLADCGAVHEPERPQTLDLILRTSRGELTDEALRSRLLERDARMAVPYDIAWANQFLLPHLVTTFPAARFVVLLRDCYTWLESIVGHVLSREIPGEVAAFLAWWFAPDRFPPTPHDARLLERGLFPLAAYLAAWNRHVVSCLQTIPEERRLILRTHELARSHDALAAFLDLPVDRLAVGNGHRNRSTWRGDIESLVDPAYLANTVDEMCGVQMGRFFPGVTTLAGARELGDGWEGGRVGG